MALSSGTQTWDTELSFYKLPSEDKQELIKNITLVTEVKENPVYFPILLLQILPAEAAESEQIACVQVTSAIWWKKKEPCASSAL